MDTTQAFGKFVAEETFSGKIPGMELPKQDHNADLAIEFAEWIPTNGWQFRHGGYGIGWYNQADDLCLSTRNLLAEFIKSKSAKPKTDQERIADLEKEVQDLKFQLTILGPQTK